MSRCCSQCGSNGHNSRTCAGSATVGGGGGSGEIMLFGVRVKVDPMRKCVSMNNLSQYVQPHDQSSNSASGDVIAAAGYASADEAVHHQSSGGRERKRGIPWTEDEHKLFLLGLQKVGKGDWRGISRNFVKTRTPTQVASHAQKYFLRRNNLNRRRRRSSLFDITTDSVNPIPMEEEQVHQDIALQTPLPAQMQPQQLSPPETTNAGGFSVVPYPMAVGPVLLPVQIEHPIQSLNLGQGDQLNPASAVLVRPIPLLRISEASTTTVLDLNEKLEIDLSPLSLKLSLSCDQNQSSPRHSAFQVMPSFNIGDGMIRVA